MLSGEISHAGVRQQQDKLFYVSPFIEMAMRYHFRVLPPGERVRCEFWKPTAKAPCSLQPSMAAVARSTPRSCSARSFASRWSPMKITAAIHWEALRLWLKGTRLVPAEARVLNTSLATGSGNDYTSPALSTHAKD